MNPTNPVNRAVEWESDIVNAFRNGATQAPLFGERDTPNGRMLYVAKPLRAGGACLRCHDTAEQAPATMIAKYGTANGFGWKVNEIIGAQIVQIPESFVLARAEKTFHVFMGSLLARAGRGGADDERRVVVDVHPPDHPDLGAGRSHQPGRDRRARLRRARP